MMYLRETGVVVEKGLLEVEDWWDRYLQIERVFAS
jgi:hypothetical protein